MNTALAALEATRPQMAQWFEHMYRHPELSIPDLEHRRAVARLFLRLVERSLTRRDEGLWSWLGERSAERIGIARLQ